MVSFEAFVNAEYSFTIWAPQHHLFTFLLFVTNNTSLSKKMSSYQEWYRQMSVFTKVPLLLQGPQTTQPSSWVLTHSLYIYYYGTIKLAINNDGKNLKYLRSICSLKSVTKWHIKIKIVLLI